MNLHTTFKAVSLFSGCGGADLGLMKAGFDVVFANDIDPDCCLTYANNIGEISCGDIREMEIPELGSIDLLTAGFPCQPFSNAGKRLGTTDKRGTLYHQVFRFIEACNPRIVVLENVRGLLSFTDENGVKLIKTIEDTLSNEYGYHVKHFLLNLSHFGVPQNRIRVILIAVKNDINIDDLLPSIISDKNLSIENTLNGLTDEIPNQNELMKLNPQAIHYGSMIPEGGSWKNIPYDLLPVRWKKIRDNMSKYHYPNFFKRYSRKDVSGTITAAFKPENAAVWHPVENRIFSVREIARIQTFPDNFIFSGKHVKSKYQQIGNAIPPLFMERLGARLIEYLKGELVLEDETDYFHDKLNINRPLAN
jgi:DNA (cytosine-5)-methyltransferase 1